jgi:hypothetical protein
MSRIKQIIILANEAVSTAKMTIITVNYYYKNKTKK